ncbi:MAG: GNAT family N-acetyltransferase [Planctomycetales bacterium]|nr:GNAT family N-acetyltransferase [Planctomycetales bacterium]
MSLRVYTNLDELAELAEPWNRLAAGVPMRSYTWLGAWARHYADQRWQPRVCAVADGDKLIGLAPWRLEQSVRAGRVLRWLGDGEVCTDHLTVLVDPGHRVQVVNELADWLCEQQHEWDALDLDHSDSSDQTLSHLFEELARRGCAVESVPDDACWAVALPTDWEAYLALQSKSHRKQLRRAVRRVRDAQQCRWTPVASRDDWEQAWPILVELHQRRRQSLGEPGCFASSRFTAFHREVSLALLVEGGLRMSWLELAGRPAAAEYHLAGDDAVYAYQGGVDPDQLAEEPGRLSTIATLQHAMQEGKVSFDLLRGDEPYKAHWRATPQPTLRRRAAAPRRSARLRAQANRAADRVRGLLKTGIRRKGS